MPSPVITVPPLPGLTDVILKLASNESPETLNAMTPEDTKIIIVKIKLFIFIGIPQLINNF
jgi:hypothetical protein